MECVYELRVQICARIPDVDKDVPEAYQVPFQQVPGRGQRNGLDEVILTEGENVEPAQFSTSCSWLRKLPRRVSSILRTPRDLFGSTTSLPAC